MAKVSEKGHFQTFKKKINKWNYIKVNFCSFKRHDLESENANHSVGKILCNKCICRWLMSIIYFYNREKGNNQTGKQKRLGWALCEER